MMEPSAGTQDEGDLRAFLSYDINDPGIRLAVVELQKELASTGANLKLVNPNILHFTIRFLGEIGEEQKDRIIGALEGKKPLDLKVIFVGAGAFPSESRISVIWLGIDKNSAGILEEESRELNLKLKEAGSFHEDAHGFSPHLTIARVKNSNRNLLEFITKHGNEEFGSCKIGPLRLKLSTLSRSGPVYSDLHVFKQG